MSEAPNAQQATYWNEAAGPTWASLQAPLDRQLARRRLSLPAYEHDLAIELHGGTQAVLATPAARTLGRPG